MSIRLIVALLVMSVAGCSDTTHRAKPESQHANQNKKIHCFGPRDGYGNELCPASFYDLLANRSDYIGHVVALEGVLAIESNKCFFYPNTFAAEYMVSLDSIAVTDASCVDRVTRSGSSPPLVVFISGTFERSDIHESRLTAGKIPKIHGFSVGTLARGPH